MKKVVLLFTLTVFLTALVPFVSARQTDQSPPKNASGITDVTKKRQKPSPKMGAEEKDVFDAWYKAQEKELDVDRKFWEPLI